VTIVKSIVVQLTAWDGTDPLSRAVAAFFGVFSGVEFSSLSGLTHVDWTHTLYGAGVAVIISLGSFYLAPPAVSATGDTVVVPGS
jgi:hypothetical protein